MTTTSTTFTPTETATLTALWDNEDEFWMYFWRLADRFIEDGDEDGGRWVKWLYGFRQRPTNQYYSSGLWYWWTTYNNNDIILWVQENSHTQCLLPSQFKPICNWTANDVRRDGVICGRLWTSPIEGLQACLEHWRSLSEMDKVDLEENWKK